MHWTAGGITAVVIVATALATAIAWALRCTWRILSRTTRFLDDYFGEPARDGLPARPGTVAVGTCVLSTEYSWAAELTPMMAWMTGPLA